MTGLWWILASTLSGATASMVWLYGRAHMLDGRTRALAHLLAGAGDDAELANWCRHMSLTVVTHTGTVYSTTLEELSASDVPGWRCWNRPMQITVWSDLDENARPEVLNG